MHKNIIQLINCANKPPKGGMKYMKHTEEKSLQILISPYLMWSKCLWKNWNLRIENLKLQRKKQG